MAGFMSWECQSGKCQQPEHADFIMSCITKYDLNRLRTVFKITCNNAAKISDGFGRYWFGLFDLFPFLTIPNLFVSPR